MKRLDVIMPGVKYHFEKMERTGYPDKLKEEKNPLIVVITAIVDTFDAVTKDRLHIEGLSFEATLLELKCKVGIKLAPDTASFLIKNFKKGELRKNEN